MSADPFTDPAAEFADFMGSINAGIAAQDAEPAQDWLFTFGAEHVLDGIPLRDRFVRVHGSFLEARLKMMAIFGRRWCAQYASAEEAGVGQYHLTELVLPVQEAAR